MPGPRPELETGPKKPGRKPTHAEVRDKLVRAGLELMIERGFRASLNKVTFVDVVEHSHVARATAYRALAASGSDSPAEWLDRELLRASLRDTPNGSEIGATASAGRAIFDANIERLAEGTVRERTDLVRAIIRASTDANFNAVINSVYWQAYMVTAGAMTTQGSNADPDVREMLRQSESATIGDFAKFYETMATVFGRRIRPEYTWGQFATMLASLVEGLALRSSYSEHVHPVERHTGPDGAGQSWNLLGVGTEALIVAMTEPIPGQDGIDLSLPDHEGPSTSIAIPDFEGK